MRILRLASVELGISPAEGFRNYHASSGGVLSSSCYSRGLAAGFRIHDADGGVCYDCCSGHISLPMATCSQKKSGEIQTPRSPSEGFENSSCWISSYSSSNLMECGVGLDAGLIQKDLRIRWHEECRV